MLENKLSDVNHPVWLAFELDTERDVVLKFVADKKLAKKERNIMVDVDHPNIIKLLHIFTWSPYTVLVLEYKAGENLLHLWEQLKSKEAMKVLKDIASALQAIHAAGLWHGDISHLNVVYQRAKTAAFLIDFSFEGKCAVGFLAPEDFADNPHRVGQATDVYRFAKLIDLLRPDLTPRFLDCFFDQPRRRPSMDIIAKRLRHLDRPRMPGSRVRSITAATAAALFLAGGWWVWKSSLSPLTPAAPETLEIRPQRDQSYGNGAPKDKESFYEGEPTIWYDGQRPLLLWSIINDQPY